MQTFLPYPDFAQSLRVLDSRRLGKQRIEARTILNVLEGRSPGRGWRNHPATLMWAGYEQALALYYNACLDEWTGRGFRNNMPYAPLPPGPVAMPWWLGHPDFHAAHRANLLRKDPAHYGPLGWSEDPSLPYWWPVKRQLG